ncbi:ATP-binding protein [Paenibacillus rhizoplanae]
MCSRSISGRWSRTYASFFIRVSRRRGLILRSDIERNVPAVVITDETRLRQVLVNLVGNAVKFTEEGEVGVCVKLEAAGEPGTLILRFSVTDTGIGIPQGSQNLLFQSFSQLDPSINRKYGGTGLGLAISKKLVELLDGAIGVNSVEGEGSEFYFTIGVMYSVEESGQALLGELLLLRSIRAESSIWIVPRVNTVRCPFLSRRIIR